MAHQRLGPFNPRYDDGNTQLDKLRVQSHEGAQQSSHASHEVGSNGVSPVSTETAHESGTRYGRRYHLWELKQVRDDLCWSRREKRRKERNKEIEESRAESSATSPEVQQYMDDEHIAHGQQLEPPTNRDSTDARNGDLGFVHRVEESGETNSQGRRGLHEEELALSTHEDAGATTGHHDLENDQLQHDHDEILSAFEDLQWKYGKLQEDHTNAKEEVQKLHKLLEEKEQTFSKVCKTHATEKMALESEKQRLEYSVKVILNDKEQDISAVQVPGGTRRFHINLQGLEREVDDSRPTMHTDNNVYPTQISIKDEKISRLTTLLQKFKYRSWDDEYRIDELEDDMKLLVPLRSFIGERDFVGNSSRSALTWEEMSYAMRAAAQGMTIKNGDPRRRELASKVFESGSIVLIERACRNQEDDRLKSEFFESVTHLVEAILQQVQKWPSVRQTLRVDSEELERILSSS